MAFFHNVAEKVLVGVFKIIFTVCGIFFQSFMLGPVFNNAGPDQRVFMEQAVEGSRIFPDNAFFELPDNVMDFSFLRIILLGYGKMRE